MHTRSIPWAYYTELVGRVSIYYLHTELCTTHLYSQLELNQFHSVIRVFLFSERVRLSLQRPEMKLICDEPAEHLKINSTSSQYRQLFKGSSSSNHSLEFTSCEPTTEEDTEDELKAPLLSINERLNEIYVSGGERRRPLKDWATSDCPQQQQHNLNLTGRRPRHKFCPFPSRRDINHRLSIWYA